MLNCGLCLWPGWIPHGSNSEPNTLISRHGEVLIKKTLFFYSSCIFSSEHEQMSLHFDFLISSTSLNIVAFIASTKLQLRSTVYNKRVLGLQSADSAFSVPRPFFYLKPSSPSLAAVLFSMYLNNPHVPLHMHP